MESFGAQLKHERQLRGIPLEEIAGATKIHLRFLQAIEENRFEDLPGEVFIRGYIRSYAETIGSDADQMLKVYSETVVKERLEDKRRQEMERTKESARKKSWAGTALTVAILLALALVGSSLVWNSESDEDKTHFPNELEAKEPVPTEPATTVIQKEPPRATQKPRKSKPPEPKKTGKKEKTKPQAEIKPTEKAKKKKVSEAAAKKPKPAEPVAETAAKPVASKPDNLEEPVAGDEKASPPAGFSNDPRGLSLVGSSASLGGSVPDSLKLTIKVKDTSWFNMTVDDSREEDFILQAGKTISFLGKDAFKLTIGYKHGVQLTLNGKAVGLPETSDETIRDFIITSQLIE